MTLGEILAEIRTITADPNDVRWSLASKVNYVNQVQEALVKRGKLLMANALLGIPGPAAAPTVAGGSSGGPRVYQYTFAKLLGNNVVAETLPSPAAAVTQCAGAALTLAALPAGYTHFRIYATTPGVASGTPYLVATQASTSFTDTTPAAGALVPLLSQFTLPTWADGTSDVLLIDRVFYNGKQLELIGLDRFQGRATDFEAQTGTPWAYLYGPYGRYAIRLYPFQPTAGGVLKLFYYRRPALFVSSSLTDVPEIGIAYSMALVYGAVEKCYTKNFQQEDASKAAYYRQLMEAEFAGLLQDTDSPAVFIPGSYL